MTNEQDKSYEEMMKNAQYRKSRGIAFFNATNSAIAIMLGLPNIAGADVQNKQQILAEWREWFLSEYDKDYAKNIAPIGLGSVDPKVINGLDKAKEAYENSQGSQPGDAGVVRS